MALSSVFRDNDLVNLDNEINKLISSSPLNTPYSAEDTTGEFIDSFLQETSEDEVGKMLENVTVPKERTLRYSIYEEIYRSVPLIKRVIRVYIANILQKNPVTGKCLFVRKVNDSTKQIDNKEKGYLERSKKLANDVIKTFNLTNKLKDKITPYQLLYGDSFVEIVDVKHESETVDFNKLSYISEANNLLKVMEQKSNYYNDTDKVLSKVVDLLVDIDQHSSYISEQDQPEDTRLSEILLRVHKPHNIIILETAYGTRVGYIEVKKETSTESFDLNNLLSNVVGKVTSLTSGKSSFDNSFTQEKVIEKLIYHIIKKIITKSTLPKNDVNMILKNIDGDMYNFLKRMIIEQGINKKKFGMNRIQARFIPSNRMISFSIPSTEYSPNGESIVDPLIFPAKLYVLSQLSNIITKLSRASLIRKWTIDVGATQMHSGLIQKLKKELYNTRTTIEDLASFKSIPKILSDFKDIFVFSKQGQIPVDVEVKSYGDPSIKIADLEDARKELISLSGIPAPYLGYMDKHKCPLYE